MQRAREPVLEHKTASGIPALDGLLPSLRLLAPAGFCFSHHMTSRGPDLCHNEYPATWQREYESRTYAFFDPVMLWTIIQDGGWRWSEVRLPDVRGILADARRHGLVYGACFSRTHDRRKTVLTLARTDREFADEEMSFLGATLDGLVREVERQRDGGLTAAELDTLRCLRDGMSYAASASFLGVSVPAIKARVEKVRGKLGARNVTHAVAVALQRRLL